MVFPMIIPKRRMAGNVTFELRKPPHHQTCSVCHHARGGEPYVKRTAVYMPFRTVVDRLCPYCIFEWEAASLILKAYPRAYQMYRDGNYHRLKLVPQLELFTERGDPYES